MVFRVAVVTLCLLLALVGAASFVVAPGASTPDPAQFDRTVAMGLTLEEQRALEERIVPRAQVAYSQYPYLVGYRGVGLAAAAVDDPLVRQQFGYPQVVYVEVAPPDVSLDESGYLVGEYTSEWIPAAEAAFVVGSDARTPSGTTPVVFADEGRAAEFASAHGGEVVGWEARDQFEVTRSDGSVARDRSSAGSSHPYSSCSASISSFAPIVISSSSSRLCAATSSEISVKCWYAASGW